MIEHQIQWTSPSPFWIDATLLEGTEAQNQMRRPAILRFAADSFMEDFLKIADTDPHKLRSLVAIRETWREPVESQDANKLLEPAPPESSFSRRLARVRLVAERAKNAGSLVGAVTSNGNQQKKPSLKLYQPAHQRYYLVTACLVCGIPGLPDRSLDTGKQEKVSFVVRRLLPQVLPALGQNLPDVDPATWNEYAMVASPSGTGWQKVEKVLGTPAALLPGEERLPLFPTSFMEDDGRKRRLFAGLIPVGKREAYMGASLSDPKSQDSANGSTKNTPNTDPRVLLLWTQVTEPWKRLIELAADTRPKIYQNPSSPFDTNKPSPSQITKALKDSREQMQLGSWYILLDFAKMLKDRLPRVIQKISGQSVSLSDEETEVVNALNASTLTTALRNDLRTGTSYSLNDVPVTLSDALIRILGGAPLTDDKAVALETKLDNVSTPYDRSASVAATVWAPFIFPLADVGVPPPGVNYSGSFDGPFPPAGANPPTDPLEAAIAKIDHLSNLFYEALPPPAPGPKPALPIGAEVPLDPREGWFVIRCAFERPNCGPLDPPLLSEMTQPFQMASFFDPDAPARPIRIALPVDTSTAGLRKFDKKAAFMISDMLCGQIDRVKGLSLGDLVLSVLPWPFHKDLSVPEKGPCKSNGLEVGMICSLSIPIITICALLLLMIIVSLLDMIFRWIPFFLICFPLPGFKAKKA